MGRIIRQFNFDHISHSKAGIVNHILGDDDLISTGKAIALIRAIWLIWKFFNSAIRRPGTGFASFPRLFWLAPS